MRAMSQSCAEAETEAFGPVIDHLITEDDTPVDTMLSEAQRRLLTEPLYSSRRGPGEGRPFLASANVGVFAEARNPAIVPDMFLGLDVRPPEEFQDKRHRSYMIWEFGKPPDLVVEIVSNREGEEDGEKLLRYARMRVAYYVVYDPYRLLGPTALRVYRLFGTAYEQQASARFPQLSLGLAFWEGEFEGKRATWLRWTELDGALIPTGKERAEFERERAETERERAEQERERAEQERERAERERQRAERLAALLRQAGIDPDAAE